MWVKSEPRRRLRAPDEAEGDALLVADEGDAPAAAAASGEDAPPPHGFRSPEYIEERLENLKRRPTWASFLDEYVDAHPDDDHDEADPETRRYYMQKERMRLAQLTKNPCGFLTSLSWSLLAVALSPLLLLLYPFLRRKGIGFWPMRCSGLGHLLGRSATNLLAVFYGLLLLYWAICRDLPELNMDNVVTRLDVRLAHLLDSSHTCQSGLTEFDIPLARELCTGVAVDALFVAATVWVILQSHRRWGRYAMAAMTLAYFLDAPSRLYDATYPSPSIDRVDPSYAMIDEEITIALDGRNLKPGGSIAWVSYWGCATTAEIATCEKQFASVFDMGVAHVTFKTIDHFIPCYRDPPNPLKAQEYVCFPSVRVRVKDKQSIPGWSKIQQQAVHASTKETASSALVAPDASAASDENESDSFADTGDHKPRLGIELTQPSTKGWLRRADATILNNSFVGVASSITDSMIGSMTLVGDSSELDEHSTEAVGSSDMTEAVKSNSLDLLREEANEMEVPRAKSNQPVVEVELNVREDSTSIDQGEVVSGGHSDTLNEANVSTDQYDNSEVVSPDVPLTFEDEENNQNDSDASTYQATSDEPSLDDNTIIEVERVAKDVNPTVEPNENDKAADKSSTTKQDNTAAISKVIGEQELDALEDDHYEALPLTDSSTSYENQDVLQGNTSSSQPSELSTFDDGNNESLLKDTVIAEAPIGDAVTDNTGLDGTLPDKAGDQSIEGSQQVGIEKSTDWALDVEIISIVDVDAVDESVVVASLTSEVESSDTIGEDGNAVVIDQLQETVPELKDAVFVEEEDSDVQADPVLDLPVEDFEQPDVDGETSGEGEKTKIELIILADDEHDSGPLQEKWELSSTDEDQNDSNDQTTEHSNVMELLAIESDTTVDVQQNKGDNEVALGQIVELSLLGLNQLDTDEKDEAPVTEIEEEPLIIESVAIDPEEGAEEVETVLIKETKQVASLDVQHLEAKEDSLANAEEVETLVVEMGSSDDTEAIIEVGSPPHEVVELVLHSVDDKTEAKGDVEPLVVGSEYGHEDQDNDFDVSVSAISTPEESNPAKKSKAEIVVPELDYAVLLQESLPEHLRLTTFQKELKLMEVVVEPEAKEVGVADTGSEDVEAR